MQPLAMNNITLKEIGTKSNNKLNGITTKMHVTQLKFIMKKKQKKNKNVNTHSFD